VPKKDDSGGGTFSPVVLGLFRITFNGYTADTAAYIEKIKVSHASFVFSNYCANIFV
jgi:hypothetical protein